MADITIPIGTSDPINLCYGLPLFPGGTIRAGIYGSSRSFSLLDASATIFVSRLKTSAYALYAFGVCGPAIAFLFPGVKVERSNPNGKGQLALTFANQELEAGAFLGLSVGAGVNLAFQLYRPSNWYKPWQLSWQDAFTASLEVSVDFIGLLVELISYLLSRNSKNTFQRDNGETLKDALPGVKSYILIDAAGGSGLRAELSAQPELVLPVNLVDFIPFFRNLNRSFGKIGGGISIGPSFHIGLPVTFSMQSFTIEGGLQGTNSATYGGLQYSGDTIYATGDVPFDLNTSPSKVTTNVHYETGFSLGLSFHFRITVAKMFNFEVNSPTLDFRNLLYGNSGQQPVIPMDGSVSSGVADSCLLIPDITLWLVPTSGNPMAQTGEVVKTYVTLSTNYPGITEAGNIQLRISPSAPGFPTSLTIEHGARTSSYVDYIFPNQSVLTGDPQHPAAKVPPGPTYPEQNYTVTASIPALQGNPCSEYQITLPLNVSNRYIHCQRASFSVSASAPPWDPLAGARINADIALPPSGLPLVPISCWFPYLPGEPRSPIPITFTLLDEKRLPHTGSDVDISVDGATGKLSPSAILHLTPSDAPTQYGNVTLAWKSKGPHNEYSNRFFLIIDAGEAFGRTEVWLDVWNWS